MSDDLSYERVLPGDDGVNLHSHTDKTTWHSVHKLILICLERGNYRLDFSPLDSSRSLILGNETWSNRYLISNLEHSLQDGSTSNTSLEVLGLLSWLVYVERSDNDHLRWGDKVSHRNWNSAQIVYNYIDVEAKLGGDGEDWSSLSNSTVDELLDIRLLFDASVCIFDDNINFILQNNDLVEVHDLDGSKMLTSLRLGAWLVTSDEEEGGVHDSRSCQHCSHEDIVTWAIDEGDMSHEEEFRIAMLTLSLILLLGTI